MPDHDELFKDLIDAFLFDLLVLFLPAPIAADLDPSYRVALNRESPADVGPGRVRRADLVYEDRSTTGERFIVHLEAQASYDPKFSKRMLYHFVVLSEIYDLPVVPMAIFSFRSPQRQLDAGRSHRFREVKFMQFDFQLIQLNRLHWRDSSQIRNPIAATFMSVMKYLEAELVEVRLECLKSLARLELSPEKRAIAQRFVDAYTRLTSLQQQHFDRRLSELAPPYRENIMTYITSWEQKGKLAHAREVALKLVGARFEECSNELVEAINKLPLEILDLLPEKIFSFGSLEDLQKWFAEKLASTSAGVGKLSRCWITSLSSVFHGA